MRETCTYWYRAYISKGIVGRESELARVEQVLDRARTGTSVLLVDGEPGIGKTALLDHAARLALDRGFRVMACRPAHREATMSYAGLSDLLAGAEAGAGDWLPGPQRRAIELAMLRRDVGGQPVDRRAVAAGVLSIIARAAAEARVLMLVDDLQWLDAASAGVLDFVIRRLDGLRVALVMARRADEAAPIEVSSALPSERVTRVRLGPLPAEETFRLLRDRVRSDLTRAMATRLHRATSGNPFFAIEVATALDLALDLGPESDPDDTLPIPADVRDLLAQRVARFPSLTRTALLAAALLADPTPPLVARAIDGDLLLALEPAENDGLLTIKGGRIRFSHPLHAAAVSATASAHERTSMHLRLARIVDDAEEQARHLAVATLAPDANVAAALESGAAAARARGAIDSAAYLLDRASVLTPTVHRERAELRSVRAAELYMRAGDRHRARRVLYQILAGSPEPEARADALRIIGELEFSENDLSASERALTAARDLTGDSGLAGRIELNLAFLHAARYDFPAAAKSARKAIDHLDSVPDSPLMAEAKSYQAITAFLCGAGVDWDAIDQAVALEDPEQLPSIGMSASAIAATLLAYVGRHREARERFAVVHGDLLERGNDVDRAQVLIWWSWMEARAGDLTAAAQLADRAQATAGVLANGALAAWSFAQRAFVAALQGDVDAASAVAPASPPRDAIQQVTSWRASTIAAYEVPRGNAAAAWEACRAIAEPIETWGLGEPVPLFFLPDAIEALADLGEVDRAGALATALEHRGSELGRTWAQATGARCRAIVAAARADLPAAVAAADDALQHHERIELPIDRARTLLVKGSALRRQRKWAQARDALEDSLAEFDRLGSALWSHRARSELARVAGRRPRSADALTPTEQRVAELAAQALTNKAIARSLSISVSTVETHLSRVYGKLEVRSRVQLASLLGRDLA